MNVGAISGTGRARARSGWAVTVYHGTAHWYDEIDERGGMVRLCDRTKAASHWVTFDPGTFPRCNACRASLALRGGQ